MRRPVLAACLLVAFAAPALRAELKFESPELIVKPKIGEKQILAEFKFTNTGAAPLAITQVHSGCGCTVPEKPAEPIAAGASGVIPVTYKPGDHQGRQVQSIQIQTGDGKTHELRLVIDLPVRVTFAPQRLLLFRGADSEPKIASLTYGEAEKTELLDVTEQSQAFEILGEPKLEQGVLTLSVRHTGPAGEDARASVRVRTRDSAGVEHTDILYLRHSPAPTQ